MDIPFLEENQFAVTSAEFSTGIVLNNDGTYFISGTDLKNIFEIFDSYFHAKEFTLQKIKKNPNFECYIVNSKGDVVTLYDTYGERK